MDEYGRGLHTFMKLDALTIKQMLFASPEPRAIIWDTVPAAILMVQSQGFIWAIFADEERAHTKRFKNAEIARRFILTKSTGSSIISQCRQPIGLYW